MSSDKEEPATASQPLSRRHILLLGGTALAALALPISFNWLAHGESSQLEAKILSLLTDQAGAARIGTLWAEQAGNSMNSRNVAARVAKRLHAYGWHPGADAKTAGEALAARVRRDFIEGNMVDVAGWQLSRTSAELCLLASLHFNPSHA
jgi:hypothetical protein